MSPRTRLVCLLIILLDRVLADSYFVPFFPVLQLLDYSYSWKMRKKEIRSVPPPLSLHDVV